jgi:hypothetical protein
MAARGKPGRNTSNDARTAVDAREGQHLIKILPLVIDRATFGGGGAPSITDGRKRTTDAMGSPRTGELSEA